MLVEELSVSGLITYIGKSNKLSPKIKLGDKELSWDGHIYIHEHENYSKESVKRVAVQVKGRSCKKLSKRSISFTVEKSDLVNYLYDGGVIIFVVYVNEKGSTKIYFSKLHPVVIKRLLKEAHKQKTKSIELIEVPSDINRFETILRIFHQDCLKQVSFIDCDVPKFEEMIRKGSTFSITGSFVASDTESINPLKAALNSDVLFFKMEGDFTSIPIEASEIDGKIKAVINTPISIKDRVYYNEYCTVISKKGVKVEIGDSIVLLVGDVNTEFSFSLKGTLRSQIRDIEFMLGIIDAGRIKVGEKDIEIGIRPANMKGFNVEKLRARLSYFNVVQSTLDALEVREELDLDSMDDESWHNLSMLVTAFTDKKPICFKEREKKYIALFRISNLLILTAANPLGDEQYSILDFRTAIFRITNSNGVEYKVSKYLLIEESQFHKISNINFQDVVFSIKESMDFSTANTLLLRLITAYDNRPSNDLMIAIKDLSCWLFEVSPDSNIPFEVRLLNKLQVIKRDRELNDEEIADLLRIIESISQDEEVLVGAYLLLDDMPAAKIHYERLDKERQAVVMQYPIAKFLKSNIANFAKVLDSGFGMIENKTNY